MRKWLLEFTGRMFGPEVSEFTHNVVSSFDFFSKWFSCSFFAIVDLAKFGWCKMKLQNVKL